MKEVFNIETVEQFKAIMEPIRNKVIEAFDNKEMTAKQVAGVLGETPAKIHYHVRELEKVGILKQIRTETKGNLIEKYYRKSAKSIIISPKFNQTLQELPPEEARDITDAHYLNFVSLMHDEVVSFINSVKPEENEDDKIEGEGALVIHGKIYATREEMTKLGDEITELLDKYSKKGKGKMAHKLYALTFPKRELI